MTNSEILQRQQVAGVRFTKVGKLYHFDYTDFPELKAGDFVIVETMRGRQMGQVMGFAVNEGDREHKPIMRPATPRDLVLKQHWQDKEPEALVICREKAKALGGYEDVKFVAAQYNYDGSTLTFMFSAEQKVNTNRLSNELRKQFDPGTQIEMRQIGPRDVAKLLGGHGACGELRCCSTFLTDFSPISIKMAKVQGISLNPSEITGMCGRLRCCLVYEYEQYVEARKHLPKRNKRVGTPQGAGKVIDVHPLLDAVTVIIEGENGGRFTLKREELIPLEELEALQKKASEPCTKHAEGEACDCGQKPGERNQDKVSARAQEKPSEPRQEKQERPERSDQHGRSDRQPRQAQQTRQDKPDRQNRPDRHDKPDRPQHPRAARRKDRGRGKGDGRGGGGGGGNTPSNNESPTEG